MTQDEPRGRCPDCYCEVQSRSFLCCDKCADRRREELKERMSHSDEIGRTSSPDSFELDGTIHGGSSGEPCHRDHPAMRSDVRWYVYKHGAG